jgi:hypothetical protein
MTWEHLYVALSRIRKKNDMRLLLKLSDRSTIEYISKLQKNQKVHDFFKGYQHNTRAPVLWNSKLAALAAGFSDPPALP